MVNRHVTRVERYIDCIAFAYLPIHFRTEHAVYISSLLQALKLISVSTRYYAEAAVFRCRLAYRKPQSNHAHRVQRPECTVLMPQNRLAGFRGFADIVGRKERDVRADEYFREVEQALVTDQPKPEGIVREELCIELLRSQFRVFFEQPVDMCGCLLRKIRIYCVAYDDDPVLLVLLSELCRFLRRVPNNRTSLPKEDILRFGVNGIFDGPMEAYTLVTTILTRVIQ